MMLVVTDQWMKPLPIPLWVKLLPMPCRLYHLYRKVVPLPL
jgi:hypothetical protein